MRSLILACLFLVLPTANAVAQDAGIMKGSWICVQNCGCQPASPEKYASISEASIARNECGRETPVEFSPGWIQATAWNLKGSVSSDNRTIAWQNGSVWMRQAPEASEIERRMAYWESQAFYCQDEGQFFPSKEDGDGAPKCDDGDSVMFNALLCRSGDERGCDTIVRSQDSDGRFWRSPAKMLRRPAEPTNQFKGGQTTFSGDHAAGLFLYFSHTLNADAFRRWVAWIDKNQRCLTWCGGMPPLLTPRYCENDRCALRIGDCQTMLLLGARMNVPVPFCAADPISPLPTVTNVAGALKASHDKIIEGLGIRLPGFDIVEKMFDESLKVYESAVAPVEALRTQLEARLVETLLIAQLDKTIAALINDRGYSRHNALVQIMMLEDMGLGRNWMNEAAVRIARDEPLNPFFQYVAYRRSSKETMLPLILEHCPGEADDPRNRRTQWSWERDTAKKEWVNRMYWDCLFVARVFRDEKVVPGNSEELTNEAAVAAINLAVVKLEQLRQLVEVATEQLKRAAALDPGKAITDIFADPVGAAHEHLEKLKVSSAEVEKFTESTLKEALHATELGVFQLPKVAEVDTSIPELTLPLSTPTPSEHLPEVTIGDGGTTEVKVPTPVGNIEIKVHPLPKPKLKLPKF